MDSNKSPPPLGLVNFNKNEQQVIDEDLAKSGLKLTDLMGRPLTHFELQVINLRDAIGYVIPYHTIDGNPIDFYRVKTLIPQSSYRQPVDTQSHLYFPYILPLVTDGKVNEYKPLDRSRFVVITEGEKKATALAKNGIPAVAVGGIWSWKNRTIVLPSEVEGIKPSKNSMVKHYKLNSSSQIKESDVAGLAEGMVQFIRYCKITDCKIIIIFDSDTKEETKYEVQNAAAELTAELRFQGIKHANIRQINLDVLGKGKTGVDDYLLHKDGGREKLLDLCRSACSTGRGSRFLPRHTNSKGRISKLLSNEGRLIRRDWIKIAYMILADMDARGARYKNRLTKDPYYFDRQTKRLFECSINKDTHRGLFGKYLHEMYGLGLDDHRMLARLNTLIHSEEPIPEVDIYRTVVCKGDAVYYRLTDELYAKCHIDAELEPDLKPKLEIHENGHEGVLFEAQDHDIDPMSQGKVLNVDAVRGFYKKEQGVTITKENRWQPTSWWKQTLKHVNLSSHEDEVSRETESSEQLIELLYYISPWLNRWRGLQLPIELIVGEAGSGKSSLCVMRMNIIDGRSSLRNPPVDIRDWIASIGASGGLHITDNLQFSDKTLKQKLSNELCRIITEPDPCIELRRLYSTAEVFRVPVRCVFVMTAIEIPFNAIDIIQRSVITRMFNNPKASFDSMWADNQVQQKGGREAWVAHQLLVINCFFQTVKQVWNHAYKARHRLVNFEQTLVTMGKTFGYPDVIEDIPKFLTLFNLKTVGETDYSINALTSFAFAWAQQRPDTKFGTKEIVYWMKAQPEFSSTYVVTNTRSLAKYLSKNKTIVAKATGIVEAGQSCNRQMYKVDFSQKVDGSDDENRLL